MNIKGYFDYNATTPLDPRVLAEMMPFFNDRFANPSSAYRQACDVLGAVENARKRVARLVSADPSEIIFTSGGTESDNLALFGMVRPHGQKGNHLITSATEHEAVLAPCRQLEKEGFALTVLPVDGHGLVAPEDLRRAIRKETILISIMQASNETGVIQPIAELASLAREHGILFHTDAVQTVGKIAVDIAELDVDLLSLSAHKIYGPKGTGALYVRRDVAIAPLFYGGGQENKRRPGTENVAGIVGLGKAAELCREEMAADALRLQEMRDRLEKELRALFPEIRVNGAGTLRTANTLNVSFPGCDGGVLVAFLDGSGLALSSGSACSAKSRAPSHVLLAMGQGEDEAVEGLRVSLGRFSSDADLEKLLVELPQAVHRLRA
ncbi:MAG: cysteine desulfurase [Candidatus Aminicenantes bacterium]|nr:cysteine desulfurase [Acidobacteriota bacterium]MCG2810231.1 cysteine desulfurase [Candidatus Aminicenantes bacterium]